MSTPRRLSFGNVVQAYDRARPGYPDGAVAWMTGGRGLQTVDLGAGTGKFTRSLAALGHSVLATDPDPVMLAYLQAQVPQARVAVAAAEAIPAPSRSVDVVCSAQSFHWFDHDVALPEIARVLRPEGYFAVVWNQIDDSIPWVRRFLHLLPSAIANSRDITPLLESAHFGWIEERTDRFWMPHTEESLVDLVLSRSDVSTLSEDERHNVVESVRAMYLDYGRGAHGMQLPYVTYSFRAKVHHQEPPPPSADSAPADDEDRPSQEPQQPPEDPGTLLVDFR